MSGLSRFVSELKKELDSRADGDSPGSVSLPMSYVDGSPIELEERANGSITDGGRTLLRLIGEDRYDDLSRWREFTGFLRIHSAERRDLEICFKAEEGSSPFAFVEGLRELELVLPGTRGAVSDFDVVVKTGVKSRWEGLVKTKRLGAEEYARMWNPTVHAIVPIEDGKSKAEIAVDCDFTNRRGDTYFKVLSNALKTPGFIRSYIERTLAPAATARLSDRSLHFQVVIPNRGYSLQDEALIQVYSGREPLRLEPADDKVRAFADRLIEEPGRGLERPLKTD